VNWLGVCLAVVVLAGCGGTEKGSTTAAPPAPTRVIRVFFLDNGQVASARRTVPGTAAAALRTLEEGPTQEETRRGLESKVVDGGSVTVADGKASVAGLEELPRAAQAQIVYTLTDLDSIRTVNGLNRANFEGETPLILVETPTFGETVNSPLRVTGTANTFEATFQYELKDAAAKVIAKHFVTATSGNGTRGTFDFTARFNVHQGQNGALVVYEISAADGSRTHVREIPLKLAP
jgi:immunoglobulin-like protein involved in spore germination